MVHRSNADDKILNIALERTTVTKGEQIASAAMDIYITINGTKMIIEKNSVFSMK